jgi:hypothetical protein
MDYQPRYTHLFTGIFEKIGEQDYRFTCQNTDSQENQVWQLITERPEVNEKLLQLENSQEISVLGRSNLGGEWLLADKILD